MLEQWCYSGEDLGIHVCLTAVLLIKGVLAINLDALFNPASVAIVGASPDPFRIGYNILESIIEGGYQGPVYPVNSKYPKILNLTCYPDLKSLPTVPELVILAVNQHITVQLAAECAQLGVKSLICSAGGFKEMGEEGRRLEEQLRQTAEAAGMLVLGPNTLGLINTMAPLYATFYPMQLPRGGVSIISQSGGLGLSILGLLQDEGVGVAKWCGVGNRGSLEFVDFINYLGDDPATGVIGIFLEGTEKGRSLVEAAAAVSQRKPVVVFKAGRGATAQKSALTHTGTLSGAYRLYRDIFIQNRILTVDSVEDLVHAMKALVLIPSMPTRKIGVITHTAGPGIVAADTLEAAGCLLPSPAEHTLNKVKKAIGADPPVILTNPLDLAGLGFAAAPYGECAAALADDPQVEALLAVYCHHHNWPFPTPELIRLRKSCSKPLVACYIGANRALDTERAYLHEAGIPLYSSVRGAAQGLIAVNFFNGRGYNG